MTVYWLELMSLPEENPILIEMLHNGRFSVNRTGNSFSRVGVDIALEQTVKRHNGLCRCCFRRQLVGCYKLYTKSIGKFLARIGWLKVYN